MGDLVVVEVSRLASRRSNGGKSMQNEEGRATSWAIAKSEQEKIVNRKDDHSKKALGYESKKATKKRN